MKTFVLRIDAVDNAQGGHPVSLIDPATGTLAESLLVATLQPDAIAPPDAAGWLAREQISTTFATARAATAELGKIGAQLYHAFALGQLQQQLDNIPAGARLILDIRDRMLAALPWELLTRDHRRLFTDATRPICRGVQEKLAALGAHEWPLRFMLVIGSDDAAVMAGVESELIREALLPVDADVDLMVVARPTKAALVERLQRFRPHLLHFIGHGGQTPAGEAYLRLDSAAGSVQWTADVILNDLQGLEDTLRFVFVNACRSTDDSKADFWTLSDAFLAAGAPAVLGMRTDVTGEEAAQFAGAIYRALAAGKAVDVAVAEGRRHLINIRADALKRREWAAPALQVRCAPEGVLTFGAGIEEQQRTHVRPTFVGEFDVFQFVDRRQERWQAWTGIQQEQRKLMVVVGEQDAGKTSFAKMLMHRCALCKHQVRYIDLHHSPRRDFLTVLRTIRDGMGGEPALLTGPLAGAAFIPFNQKVNEVLEAEIPAGATADQDMGKAIVQAEHYARASELLDAFRESLKSAIGPEPVTLVLDHLDLPPNEFHDYLRPLLKELCQLDLKLCFIVVPRPDQSYDWQPLQPHLLNLPIGPFPEQEWVDLALDYIQRRLDPTRFADDAARRACLGRVRGQLGTFVGLWVKGNWTPKLFEIFGPLLDNLSECGS
jgi:hypothetical protein